MLIHKLFLFHIARIKASVNANIRRWIMNKDEIWKDIKDFPNYEVSNRGRVRNKSTKYVLRPGLGGVGYLTVALYKDGKGITKNVHDLVARAFLGDRKDGMTVNHIDGDKTNNNLKNLEFVSRKENNIHAYTVGLNQHKKRVKIVETGETFDSIKDCAKAIGGDGANISSCLKGKLKTHKGLHFEEANDKKKPFLYDYQMDAVKRLRNGSILCGGVGSGKSRTALYYYFSQQGGSIDPDYIPMKNPKNLLIITTAQKRDSLEWEGELAYFIISKNPEASLYKNDVVIDSWNNIQKYKDISGWFILFDEQRVCGSGAWVKSFLKMAKSNDWILLSATPGDTYMDYVPVFIANGFFKNRTDFTRQHVVYSRFSKYPKIDHYYDTGKLERYRRKLLVDMDFKRQTVSHHEDIYVGYDVQRYKETGRLRWDPFKNEPIRDAAGLCYVWRKIVNSDPSRLLKVLEICEKHPRVIIFYSYDYELDLLKGLYYGKDYEIAEYNGHRHDPLPTGEKWVYLVNYSAGNAGWNCTTTDTIVFYSQNYSYKVMEQAAGRIDRLNTPFRDLYYYHLKSRSGIDLAISKALREKKNFNEGIFVKW